MPSTAAIACLHPGDSLPRTPADLEVVATVRERDPEDRRGLAEALAAIAGGEASALLVARLGSLAGSLGELVRLIGWLEAHGATLVALDVGLDTARPAGRRAVMLLREIQRWARQPELPRRPPGRPGLQATAPGVAERIGRMRERGLSLRAIADALNADGVPTPRGGRRWRASSVQAALGYRRPDPPVPGLPHPPARPPRPPGRPPRPHRGRP